MEYRIFQRQGNRLVEVELGAKSGGGLASDALEITSDGNLVIDTDKAGGVKLAINSDGILEVE